MFEFLIKAAPVAVYTVLGLSMVALIVAVFWVIVNRHDIVASLREAWDSKSPLRDADGKFLRNPTLDEARKFAGARGEPAVTAAPVILPPDKEDAIDESARKGMFKQPSPTPSTGQTRFTYPERSGFADDPRRRFHTPSGGSLGRIEKDDTH